eukprot:scaffold137346_cov148-Phaeocystis_antarctica.AAC.3
MRRLRVSTLGRALARMRGAPELAWTGGICSRGLSNVPSHSRQAGDTDFIAGWVIALRGTLAACTV